MSELKIQICRTASQFQPFSDVWDELWSNSKSQNPNLKSGALLAACDSLYSGEILFVLAMEGQRAVAAIPLVKQKSFRFVSVYGLPNNQWGCWGDLLIHNQHVDSSVFVQIADAISNSVGDNLSLDQVDLGTGRWKQFCQAFANRKHANLKLNGFDVGIIEHCNDWNDFQNQLSKGFRKKLRRYRRGLEAIGDLSFEFVSEPDLQQLEDLFREAFSVESRSWKAKNGTTIASQNMFEFYLDQAKLHAIEGSLRISLLRLDNRAIAFEFGVVGKDTYYSWKIGYDENFARHAPGQVLAKCLAQEFHNDGGCVYQDTVGPISEATAKWATRNSNRCRLLIQGSSKLAKLQFHLVKFAREMKRSKTSLEELVANVYDLSPIRSMFNRRAELNSGR